MTKQELPRLRTNFIDDYMNEVTLDKVILNIVHSIDLRDIKVFVEKQFIGIKDCPETSVQKDYLLAKLLDKLEIAGYKVLNIDIIASDASEKERAKCERQFKKDLASSKRLVSLLSKKLGQIQEITKNY